MKLSDIPPDSTILYRFQGSLHRGTFPDDSRWGKNARCARVQRFDGEEHIIWEWDVEGVMPDNIALEELANV